MHTKAANNGVEHQAGSSNILIDVDTNYGQNVIGFNDTENMESQSTPSSNIQKSPKQKAANGKLFECTECKYATPHKSKLIRHKRIHDKNVVKPFTCEHCEYAAQYKSGLTVHQQVHVQQQLMGVVPDPKDGLFKCTLCDRKFTKWFAFKRHSAFSHKNDQSLFNCAKCTLRFTQKDEKDSHETGCNNLCYKCDLCKTYITKNENQLQEHMVTHSGAKPFKCMICNRKFGFKSSLRRHLKIVHNNVNFKFY